MNILKRSCSVLLAALLLTQFASCQGGTTEDTTPAATTTANPEDSKTPGFAALTEEDKATYAALAAQNADRANVLGTAVETYYISGRGENLNFAMYLNTSNLSTRNIASVWHISSVLSMTSKLWSVNAGGKGSSYANLYTKILSSMDYYKGTELVPNYSSSIQQTMYAVNRASQKNGARLVPQGTEASPSVYDDQMWIVRELIYVYKLTGEQTYLDQALSLTKACLDAWDTTVINGKEVGGIDWGPGYDSKHTCSNAPLIEPLVELYEIFRDEGRENPEYYLDWAEKIYDWTNDHLRLSNGLYGDLVRPQGGRVSEGTGKNKHWITQGTLGGLDSTTYSYNTGAMISGGAALYRATGKSSYLTDAKKSARAAYRTFGVTETIGDVKVTQYSAHPDSIYRSTTWFNLILLEGFIDLYPYDTKCKSYIDAFQQSLDYAYEHHLTEEGLMPRDLYNGWNKKAVISNDDNRAPDTDKDIMDQASYAEMYAALSEFYAYAAAQ